jgi:hypothetical protein
MESIELNFHPEETRFSCPGKMELMLTSLRIV